VKTGFSTAKRLVEPSESNCEIAPVQAAAKLGSRFDKCPRVLILSHEIPNTLNAGSILLHRLFRNWPADRLLVVGPELPSAAERLTCEYVTFRPRMMRLETSRFAAFSRLLTLSGCRSICSQPVNNEKHFNFDIVLTVMQNLAYSDAAYRMSEKYGIPLVVIVHDDPEDFEASYAWTLPLIRRRNAYIYRRAVLRFCISPEMRDMLSLRYGAPGEVMYPNRSESLVARPAEESLSLKNPNLLTVGYAGALSYGYGQRLQELVPVFRQAGVQLRIYSRNTPTFEAGDVVSYHGCFRTPEEIFERIKNECDAVILPYCYPQHGHQALYRTHFPSKLPEYLALGMPVLISGPDYATGVKWGIQNQEACIVITEQFGPTWLKTLASLKARPDLRSKLAVAAVTIGNRHFDPKAITNSFNRNLCSLSVK